MPVYFKADIRKESPSITRQKLMNLLDRKEPMVVRFLARLWKKQQGDISYAEIRQMILSGDIDANTLARWRQDYSQLVIEELMPQWREMIDESAVAFSERWPSWSFDPNTEQIAAYTAQHAAELVTNSTAQQIEAIRSMVQRAATVQDVTVDQLAYIIRPTIGLYKNQAVANLNYYNAMKQNLIQNHPRMKRATIENRAQEAAIKYAEKQHRYRAHMIARTELAFGYNNGEYNAIQQARAQGYMGRVKKQPATARDERVCDLCKALAKETVDINEPFSNGAMIPPFHPHCRCVLDYIEA